MREDIAFAQLAFSEQALAIMTTRPGDHDGIGAGAGAGGWSSNGGGGAVGGGESWDRRLARPENFLQLCRDDTCGKMRTLKVSSVVQSLEDTYVRKKAVLLVLQQCTSIAAVLVLEVQPVLCSLTCSVPLA